MNDDNIIRVGDLVVVTNWPCCPGDVGKVFTVGDIIQPRTGHCSDCKQRLDAEEYIVVESNNMAGWPISTVKKIKPLTDDEIAEEKKELENEIHV